MVTRRATRSAAAVAEQHTPSRTSSPSTQLLGGLVVDSSPTRPNTKGKPHQKGKRSATTKAEVSSKRNKPNPPIAQPIKGGWVLPHGMGLAVGGIDTTTASAKNSISPQDETPSTTVDEGTTDPTDEIMEEPVTGEALSSETPEQEANTEATAKNETVATPTSKDAPTSTVKPRSTRTLSRHTREAVAVIKETTPLVNDADITMDDAAAEPVSVEARTATVTKRRTRASTAAAAGLTPMTDNANISVTDAIKEQTPTKSSAKKSTKRPTKNSDQTPDVKAEEEVEKPLVALIDQKMKVKRGAANKYGLTRGTTPYPNRLTIPSKEQCEEVYKALAEMHGEVHQPTKAPAPSLNVAGCGEVPSVLDALLRTLISGNTLMANANAAIKRLVETYGILSEGIGAGSINWNAVRLGSLDKLIDAIRPAGCPKLKGAHIKAILDMVHEEQKTRANAHLEEKPVPGAENEDAGQKALEVQKAAEDYLSLDHMHAMTADEAITEFVKYPGIGVKTAACVVLFCLRIPCFAVDTHVHKFCVWLGWVPEKANELDTFNHGEYTVPNHLKYGLHQLFIRHGQQCFKCRKNTKPGTKAWDNAPECPLEHLVDRSRGNFGRVGKEEDAGEDEVKQEDLVADKAVKGTKRKGTKAKSAIKEEDVEVETTKGKGAKPKPVVETLKKAPVKLADKKETIQKKPIKRNTKGAQADNGSSIDTSRDITDGSTDRLDNTADVTASTKTTAVKKNTRRGKASKNTSTAITGCSATEGDEPSHVHAADIGDNPTKTEPGRYSLRGRRS